MRYYALIAILFAGTVFAEEPIMLGTQDTQTISQWILSNNPPCEDWDKIYTGYAKLATDPNKECKRYRPWICATTGAEGVDVEPLPAYFCK